MVGCHFRKIGLDILTGWKNTMNEEQPKFKIEKQEAHRDILQAGRDIIIQQPSKMEPLTFPSPPSLHNQTPPEPNFVGRKEMLETITDWYTNPEVRIGALIGWGGVGKSALVRKWYDELESNNITPDGIFWWGFYRNAYLEQFLNALLRYVSQGRIEPETIKSTWMKTDMIKEYINQGAYLIILDGLEQMQKPASGDEFGKMIHRECTELLHYFADAPKGLCLITSRYPLKDLDDWHKRSYKNLSLIDLSTPDSLSMLRSRGIKGSDEEMTEVINRYKGHALSLTSLAGYLNRYYAGDIKQAPEVEFVLGDRERFKDVNKLLRKYAEKMSDSELIFLYIFSLFRKEVTGNDFAGVFRHKIKGTEFNKVLVRMHEFDFRDLINGLVDWWLISYDKTKKTYTSHPLIKGYFESDFDEKDKKLCHKRIYQYFGEYAPEQPETLEEMQPLFEQVYHGCAAGLYDEVFNDIYRGKIQRWDEYYLVLKLGAWGTDLDLVLNFFPLGDTSRMPLVSERSSQLELISETGPALLCIGKPTPAESLIMRAIKMSIEDGDYKNASISYRTLAENQFRIGEVIKAQESAKYAVKMATAKHMPRQQVRSISFLAYTLLLSGEIEKAEQLFKEANNLQRKIEADANVLYSIEGVFYADFLTMSGRYDEAFKINTKNLEICTNQKKLIAEVSRCLRSLGGLERIKENHDKANEHLNNALDIACRIGIPDLEIEALIERGRVRLDTKDYDDAEVDSNAVLKLCERTGFELYEPEAEMVLSKAYLALNDIKQAKTLAHSAYEKAIGMKYRWQEGDAAHLLGEIYLKMGDKESAGEWLEKAVACRKEILDPKVEESERTLEGL